MIQRIQQFRMSRNDPNQQLRRSEQTLITRHRALKNYHFVKEIWLQFYAKRMTPGGVESFADAKECSLESLWQSWSSTRPRRCFIDYCSWYVIKLYVACIDGHRRGEGYLQIVYVQQVATNIFSQAWIGSLSS